MATATARKCNGSKNVHKPANGASATDSVRRGGRTSSFHKLVSKDLVRTLQGYGNTIISVVDTAELFGVTTQTIRQWSKSGYLPASFFPDDFTDRKLYFNVAEMSRYIQKAIDNG